MNGSERRVEAELLALAVKKVGKAQSEAWAERLLEVMPNGQSRIEWLRTGPASRKPRGLANHIAKITFLKQLGADELELGIPTLFLKGVSVPFSPKVAVWELAENCHFSFCGYR